MKIWGWVKTYHIRSYFGDINIHWPAILMVTSTRVLTHPITMKIGVLESEMPRGCWRLDPIKTGQMCFFHTGTKGFNLFSVSIPSITIGWSRLNTIRESSWKETQLKHSGLMQDGYAMVWVKVGYAKIQFYPPEVGMKPIKLADIQVKYCMLLKRWYKMRRILPAVQFIPLGPQVALWRRPESCSLDQWRPGKMETSRTWPSMVEGTPRTPIEVDVWVSTIAHRYIYIYIMYILCIIYI
jgi:hypothetical protein